MACGIAYAVRAVEKGDSEGLRVGLDTASRFAGNVEKLMPSGRKAARAVRTEAAAIGRTVAEAARKKKRIPKEGSAAMLERLRGMGKRAEELFSEGSGRCGNAGKD